MSTLLYLYNKYNSYNLASKIIMLNESDSIKKNFFKYLNNLSISAKSHKNYRSDISHFTNWIINKVKSFGSYSQNLTDTIPFISHGIAVEYKNDMAKDAASIKTANRRLSTLRHFARFLVSTQIIDSNFMEGVENILSTPKIEANHEHPMLSEFRTHLESQNVSKNTMKNYLSDIRQFLVWIETNQTI